MALLRELKQVRVYAPAKTNLFLNVGKQRHDGYHAVTTVLCPLTLHDTLYISPTQGESSLTCEGGPQIEPQDNLVMHAVDAMKQEFHRPDDHFEIKLTKRIPVGAGLGGGSSDAAAVVAGVAHLWGVDRSDKRLVSVASKLGADVPFFLHGGAALMDGRGDVVQKQSKMMRIPAVIAKPQDSVSTAQAYTRFDELWQEEDALSQEEERAHLARLFSAIEDENPAAIGEETYNNMTQAATDLVPRIQRILGEANPPEVLGSFVSGSGSAVIALCKNEEDARKVVKRATQANHWCALVYTDTHGVKIVEE